MSSSHTRRMMLKGSHRRAGLFAATEITVVVAMLVVLCWAGSCLVSLPDDELAAQAAMSRACSDRPVYRLAMEETGNRLWVFRPSQEVTGLNLVTGQIDKSRSSSGVALSMVAHSRDGATSLLVTHDNFIWLDREGLDPVWTELSVDSPTPTDLAVSADGSVALVALSDGTVHGWSVIDTRAGAFEYRLPQRGRLTRMCLDGDGLRLFAVFNDGSASIHDAITGKTRIDLSRLDSECTSAVWSDDGRRIAVSAAGGSVGLIDAESGERVWNATANFRRELLRITSLAISPDGRWLAAGGLNTQCIVWDVTTPDVVRRLSGHDGLIRSLVFSPHANSLFTGGLDGTIREWSLESFATLRKFE
ncbi:MAG: hypothetical protein H7062_02915 [Candidatus Saccharimonas sp.]|nr:hypothetical protein [Planctomycetaceae bacterium]